MKTSVLPAPRGETPHIAMQVALSGRSFEITWFWNARDAHWFFSMQTVGGVRIVDGVRVVLGGLLNAGGNATLSPPGWLTVVDPTGGTADPGLMDFSARFRVVYVEADDNAGA